MKRTALMMTIGITAAMMFGSSLSASAQGLLFGMPGGNMMQDYNQIMRQYGGGGFGGGFGGVGLMMGMPTTNIMQDYYRLLPQLQALQAWGHANGMPYALPGTLGGYGGGGSSASTYWGNKWDEEYIREQTPVYENNGGHYTLYGNGDEAE